jgi:hypothetical protein
MFEVRTNSPMDDEWQERDAKIKEAAGRISDFSGGGVGDGACMGRDHGYVVETFAEAQALKKRLETVPLVNVTIREG